jgi:hypothetical protein
MQHKTRIAAAALAFAAGTAAANGIHGQGSWETTLSARDLDGNWANGPEAYYDRQLDITWLANPKALAGTQFDTYFRGGADDQPYDNESNETDGRAVLSDAFFWATQLHVGGVSGWRLPTTDPVNGSFYRYQDQPPKLGTGTTGDTPWSGRLDVGWNITSTQSEMAHLFYVTLGNLGAFDTDGRPRGADEISFNTGVFGNLAARKFWSGSKYRSDLQDIAWVFDFASGKQQGSFTELPFPEAYYAWAVHDGDVGLAAPVPEPAGWVSMLLGLAGVAHLRRRRHGGVPPPEPRG